MENKLSFEQREKFISKLEKNGFEVSGISVYVQNPKSDHPKWGRHHLPVGCIWGQNDELFNHFYSFELVNADEKFSEDYHSKLKEIYNSI